MHSSDDGIADALFSDDDDDDDDDDNVNKGEDDLNMVELKPNMIIV